MTAVGSNGGPTKQERGGELCGRKAKAQPVRAGLYVNPGDDLLSHTVAHAVPSTLEGLTAVFGMGTGVTPPV